MTSNGFTARFLRFIGIVLMGLTVGFTLLGGIGTSCVALNPDGFGASMAKLAPFQWLYVLFVLLGAALGVMGIRATILLVKGAPNSYRSALFVLAAGIAIGVIHMLASRALRGSSMPVDAVTYTTVLTLVVFLILRIPTIWQGVDFAKGHPRANQSAGGAAAIMIGLLTLTVKFLMGSTHTWDGVNFADAFHVPMTIIGFLCLLVGAGLGIRCDTHKTYPSLERGFSDF